MLKNLLPGKGTVARKLLRELTNSQEERPCTQDPELWWMTDYASVREAKRRCNGTYSADAEQCPLLEICAQYAVIAVEKEGVWGGLSPDDRVHLRRKIAKNRHQLKKRAKLRESTTEHPDENEIAS